MSERRGQCSDIVSSAGEQGQVVVPTREGLPLGQMGDAPGDAEVLHGFSPRSVTDEDLRGFA